MGEIDIKAMRYKKGVLLKNAQNFMPMILLFMVSLYKNGSI